MEILQKLTVKNKRLPDKIYVYNSVDSTNQIIAEYLANGEKPPIAASFEQMNGEGRMGRKWLSSAGKGLWFSFYLEWKEGDHYYVLVFAVALAIREALIKLGIAEDRIVLKWPNDVLVDRKKIAGILIKSEMQNQKIVGFTVGIGINVNNDRNDFGEELNDTAISLKMLDSIERDIISSLQSVIGAIDNFLDYSLNLPFNEVLELWKRRSLEIGYPIRIQQLNKEPIEAEYQGIDDSGALLAMYKKKIIKILTGDVGV